MRTIVISLLFVLSIFYADAQNIGISTDGTAPETGVMLDVKGTNVITTTATQNVFQVKSFNASGAELKMRMVLGTHATAGSRYGALEVYDAGAAAYRTLALQPSGGFVGIGTTGPAAKLANTSVNTLDLTGNGISTTNGFAWLVNSNGYVASFVNTDATVSARNGVLIKTTATDAASYPLQINVGANSAMVIRGDRNVGIGTYSPSTRLDVQGTSGTTLKIVDGNEGTGKVLTSNATGVASWAPLSSIPGNCMQNVWAQFRLPSEAAATLTTSITYTFTTDANTTKIYVELWGGGGGGDVGTAANNSGGGGGGYAAAYITVTPSTNYTVVVGGGGAYTSLAAGNGGNSTFNGTVLVAGGGVRGSSTAAGGTATTTLGSGNAILIPGNDGAHTGYYDVEAWIDGVNSEDYGPGGNAGGIGGGKGGSLQQNGSPPGGGGGCQGGKGSPGGVIIRW